MLSARLWERVGETPAPLFARLSGYALSFNKLGSDGSGKCSLEPREGAAAQGCIYEITPGQFELLERFEGGYRPTLVAVQTEAQTVDAHVFLALPDFVSQEPAPFGWYHRLVLAGAREIGCDPAYLAMIQAFQSVEDPRDERSLRHDALLPTEYALGKRRG